MSKLFKQQADYLARENRKYGNTLQLLEGVALPPNVTAVWRSNRFLAQVFAPVNGALRISVNRAAIDTTTGKWLDGISWEDLQRVKRELGFADRDAVEVYPPDGDMVNVANMRHLWILDSPLAFAWRRAP